MINDDGVVEMQHPEDENVYKELNALKLKKPSLKTAVTVGMFILFVFFFNRDSGEKSVEEERD
jgi:hypothetical protein